MSKTTLHFGRIDQIILFGGGQTLADLARYLVGRVHVEVITSKRHALASVDAFAVGKMPLLQALESIKITATVTDDIESILNKDRIRPSTLGISIGAEWIFKADFIQLFGGRLVNLHGSRLPKMRGGGGFSWLILMNSREGGSTIHQLVPGIDKGAIVCSCEYTYDDSCRKPADYIAVTQRENRRLLVEFIEGVLAGKEFNIREQAEDQSTYWPRLNTLEHGFIDWSWNAQQIERFICAFDDPYQGASTFLRGERVFLKNCQATFKEGVFHPFQCGYVYRKMSDSIFVSATDGSLIIRDIKDTDGTNLLDRIRLGDRFFTPKGRLEQAAQFRAVMRPEKL